MQSQTWQRKAWIAFVLVLPAVIIYSFYAKLLACPACYLFLDSGDGLKNYFTIAHYVLHDSGWHFSGMNYPYGEHIIYTDNQPILAMTLRWIHHHVVALDRHIIGIVNMLLVISLYIGVLVQYKLLRRWNIGRWWALASAVCIIFLSPQILRFQGHYGLGYVCFVPLLILFLDMLVRGEKRKWIWAVAIGALIFCASLIHMYFLFLLALTASAFLLFWWWYNRKEKNRIRPAVWMLLSAILIPGILLVAIRSLTDHVPDRPTEPWGLDYHCLDFKTTFFSFIEPFDKAWGKIFDCEKPIIEKVTYTGVLGLIMLPAMLYFLFRKKEEDPISLVVKTTLAAAVICWCMGAGVFYQNGLKFIWNAIPILKQFRGLGRFGIPFYYLYMLCCSYVLWRVYLQLKQRDLGRIGSYILVISGIVWGFEARAHMLEQTAPIYHINETFHDSKEDYLPILTAAGYKPEDFQAILQFPMVAIGNEMMGVTHGFWWLKDGFHVSWETGLPMIDYAMSRTSIAQGLDIVELISAPYQEKKRAKLFSDLPILLVVGEDKAIPGELRWTSKAVKIGSRNTTVLYSLPVSAFREIENPLATINRDSITCTGWFLDFEDHPCDTAMTGIGAMPITTVSQSLWKYQDTASVERQWALSLWTYVDHYTASVAVPRIMETDPQGNVTKNEGYHRDNLDWTEAYGPWLAIQLPLTTKGKGYTYELFIENTGTVIDNVMIRSLHDTCVYTFPGVTLFNNIPIPTE